MIKFYKSKEKWRSCCIEAGGREDDQASPKRRSLLRGGNFGYAWRGIESRGAV